MRIVARALMLSAAVVFIAVCSGLAADQQKIAVVDMDSLLKAHPETKSAESLLQKQVDEFETEQKEMMAELEKLKKAFDLAQKETENKALSDIERDKKKAALEEKYTDLRDQDRKIRETASKAQKQIGEQRGRMVQRIIAKIRDKVKIYAEKEKYSLVLDGSAMAPGGVVYSMEKNDITADIRKLIEQDKKDVSDKADK